MRRMNDDNMWLPGFAPGEDPLTAFPPKTVAAPSPQLCDVPEFEPAPVSVAILEAFESVPERQIWPRLDESMLSPLAGKVTKFEANLAAISLLDRLEQEDRAPSDDERIVLHRYTGWGGLPEAFNPNASDPGWVERIQRLKAILGESAYESARASVNSAFFTEPYVIRAMWKALQKMGFEGGKILDPSAGAGYFIGAMPQEIARRSSVTAVEIDEVSARLVRSLYGAYDVRCLHTAFEKARLPENGFDLAISNIPFGAFKAAEMRHVVYRDFSIHNYFFARALEVVRPGGIVAFVTSTATLDSRSGNNSVRQYLASQADLLGAIRLPAGTFERLANTAVATDIVFLRKREAGAAADHAGQWLSTEQAHPTMQTRPYETHHVCQWYIDHPQMMIGKLELRPNGHTRATSLVFDASSQGCTVQEALEQCIEQLPQGCYQPRRRGRVRRACVERRVETAGWVKPGSFVVTPSGEIGVSEGDHVLVRDDIRGKRAERVAGLIRLRELARKLIEKQALAT